MNTRRNSSSRAPPSRARGRESGPEPTGIRPRADRNPAPTPIPSPPFKYLPYSLPVRVGRCASPPHSNIGHRPQLPPAANELIAPSWESIAPSRGLNASSCEFIAPGCELIVPGCELTAPSCELTAPSCELIAPSLGLMAPSCELIAPSCELFTPRLRTDYGPVVNYSPRAVN